MNVRKWRQSCSAIERGAGGYDLSAYYRLRDACLSGNVAPAALEADSEALLKLANRDIGSSHNSEIRIAINTFRSLCLQYFSDPRSSEEFRAELNKTGGAPAAETPPPVAPTTSVFCTNCGTKFTDTADRYCSRCGRQRTNES